MPRFLIKVISPFLHTTLLQLILTKKTIRRNNEQHNNKTLVLSENVEG